MTRLKPTRNPGSMGSDSPSPDRTATTMSPRRITAFFVLLGALYVAATLRGGLGMLSPVVVIIAVIVAILALAVVIFDLPWSRPNPRIRTQPPLRACPACGSTTLVDGGIYSNRNDDGRAERFFPKGLRLLALRHSVGLNGRHPFRACLSCGHLWSALDAEALRELMEANGVKGREPARHQKQETLRSQQRR